MAYPTSILSLLVPLLAASPEEPPLTLPRDQRPAWVREEGIVMAGSWEPLLFRVRRDGRDGYDATPEERAAYEREHSPEMLAMLRSLGVNFVMMHAYKGFGMEAERGSLQEAKAFAELCRKGGLRVGCYTFSGTLGWELFLKERPEASGWVVLDPAGKPVPYGSATYRHYLDRRHPEAVEYLRRVVRFAVEEMRTDLLHFDNYIVGPGYGPRALADFRGYLAARYSPEELERRFGSSDLARLGFSSPATAATPLGREYLRFACGWLAESYRDMARCARSLRPDVLLELNPGGVGAGIRSPVDHWLMLRGGEAFWDEGRAPGWDGKTLRSRIRTYKVGRTLGNMTFAYVTCPLEAAESIAFNLDCLGCIAWFEYGRLVAQPGSEAPVSPLLGPWVRLFRRLQRDWGGRDIVADVAAFRPLDSQLYLPESADVAWRAEDVLIRKRVPFRISGHTARDPAGDARVLLVAGGRAMSDAELDSVLECARRGRGLVLVGPTGTLAEDLSPRSASPLERWLARPLGEASFRTEKDGARCAYFPALPGEDELVEALRWAAGGGFSVEIRAPDHVAAEVVRGGRGSVGVHLVDYAGTPVSGVEVRVATDGKPRRARWITAASPDFVDLPVRAAPESGSTGRAEVSVSIPALDVHGFLVVE